MGTAGRLSIGTAEDVLVPVQQSCFFDLVCTFARVWSSSAGSTSAAVVGDWPLVEAPAANRVCQRSEIEAVYLIIVLVQHRLHKSDVHLEVKRFFE